MNVHNSTIHNSQKVETTQMSRNGWMDEQNVVYTYDGILLSRKKEWSSDTFYSADEPWKHDSMWKKPNTKGHILWFHLYEISRIGMGAEERGK